MNSRVRVIVACLSLFAAAWALPRAACADDKPPAVKGKASDRPFLAIWRDSDGYVLKSEGPYLRVAIWDDGRVLFAKEPSKWGHELFEGRIPAYRVARLKKALVETGVFELKGHCYLGPDQPVDCIMIDLGKKKQMLYWLEGMMSWMESKPHRLEFAKCWKSVNNLALVACPDRFEVVKERFQRPPKSWYVKKAIQSE